MKKIPMARAVVHTWLVILFLGGCTDSKTSAAAAQVVPAQTSDTSTQKLKFASAATESEYVYKVFLPAAYSTSGKRYPVIYMTDAQWNFDAYTKTLADKNLAVILVGIEQTSEYRRLIDFTTIGYEGYSVFLKQEFVPFIEDQYRTNGSRIYAGLSLGALFGGYLLTQEPTEGCFFCTYFLFDGTFNLLSSSLINAEERRLTASRELHTFIFLTGADPGNHEHVSAFEARYKARGYSGLKIDSRFYKIHHNQVAVPSFKDAVDALQQSCCIAGP